MYLFQCGIFLHTYTQYRKYGIYSFRKSCLHTKLNFLQSSIYHQIFLCFEYILLESRYVVDCKYFFFISDSNRAKKQYIVTTSVSGIEDYIPQNACPMHLDMRLLLFYDCYVVPLYRIHSHNRSTDNHLIITSRCAVLVSCVMPW